MGLRISIEPHYSRVYQHAYLVRGIVGAPFKEVVLFSEYKSCPALAKEVGLVVCSLVMVARCRCPDSLVGNRPHLRAWPTHNPATTAKAIRTLRAIIAQAAREGRKLPKGLVALLQGREASP